MKIYMSSTEKRRGKWKAEAEGTRKAAAATLSVKPWLQVYPDAGAQRPARDTDGLTLSRETRQPARVCFIQKRSQWYDRQHTKHFGAALQEPNEAYAKQCNTELLTLIMKSHSKSRSIPFAYVHVELYKINTITELLIMWYPHEIH